MARMLAPALAVLLAGAAPAQWQTFSRDGLTFSAPDGTRLESASGTGTGTGSWDVRNAAFWLNIRFGNLVADGDDSEPLRCYRTEPIVVDGHAAVLRISKEFARLDCPERYASVYIHPERPGGSALYLSAQARRQDDMPSMLRVIATLHFAHW